MRRKLEASSRDRPRVLPLGVLFAAASWIALANWSAELLSIDFPADVTRAEKAPERAYGWPLTWYWREGPHIAPVYPIPAADVPRPHRGFWRNFRAPWNPQSPVSRSSVSRLVANVAIWLAILAALWVACRRLRLRNRLRIGRPRITTFVVLIVVTALTLLANLSCDAFPEHGQMLPRQYSYGWPLIWYRYIDSHMFFTSLRWWDYSAARLVGNLASWFAMLLATGLTSEWMLRRYRPRFRWSLRTMFAGVALAAALCAWGVALKNRADEQDALAEQIGELSIGFESWGPQWLDLVGVGRFRRIIAAHVDEEEMNEELLEHLARLRSLRLLDIDQLPLDFTPGMAAALGEMRQLRVLNVNCVGDDLDQVRSATHECLAAVGKLPRLERLGLEMFEESGDDLACLAGLTTLKTLSLEILPFAEWDGPEDVEGDGEARTLAYLPLLPRLEALLLSQPELGDRDLGRLAGFPRLKLLDLSNSSVSDVGLAKFAPSESLEELAIDEVIATAPAFEALVALKHLKAVHIIGPDRLAKQMEGKWDKLARRHGRPWGQGPRPVTLRLDDGNELVVLPIELDGLHRALHALRQSHPGIVIDAGNPVFRESFGVAPQWLDPFEMKDSSIRRLLNER